MKSSQIMVDPKILSMDMPVDEKNVKDIERQIKAWGGIHTRVEVWMNPDTEEVMISDGFHRTQAAVNLGMKEIPALLLDCTVEEFWDKRISQAKKHAAVSDDRLHQWILSAWNNGEFAGSVRDDSFASAIYTIHQGLRGSKKFSVVPEFNPLLDWFQKKAALWGMEAVKVASIILEKEKVFRPDFSIAKAVAVEEDLTVKQAKKLTEAFPKAKSFTGTASQKNTREYAKQVIAKGLDLTPEQFLKSKSEEEERKRKSRAAFEATPAGMEDKRKRRVENAITSINALRTLEHHIESLLTVDFNEVFLSAPEKHAKLKSFIGKVARLSTMISEVQAVSPLSDSERLSLNSKIARLDHELYITKNQPIVSPSHMALSSSEISRLP